MIINENTKVIVQGITGKHGSFHTELMLEYGTKIVAGVTPGKKGESVHGIPVYNSVKEALAKHQADFSVVFVPAGKAKDAVCEAVTNSLNVVLITENIPIHDVLHIIKVAKEHDRIIIGPNCPGIITAGCKLGIMPNHIYKEGTIGVISRSGTLTYEILDELSRNNLGQSTVVGIGGDTVIGSNFIDMLKYFEEDDQTTTIVLIGEIGGNQEEKAAEFIKDNISKKCIAYIAGITAPEGKRMGHAGAIISGSEATADAKIKAFEKVNVHVAKLPSDIISMVKLK